MTIFACDFPTGGDVIAQLRLGAPETTAPTLMLVRDLVASEPGERPTAELMRQRIVAMLELLEREH